MCRSPKGKEQFSWLSRTFKVIGNIRCNGHCSIAVCIDCKLDHSIANNVMQQTVSFSMPGKRKWYKEKLWAQVMRLTSREGGGGIAEQSDIHDCFVVLCRQKKLR